MRGQRRGFSALHFLVRGNQGLDWVAEKGNLHGVCLVGCLFGRAHIFRRPFSTGRNCSRNSLVMALSCCSPFAIIVPEESSKETRFSRKCAIYFPTYDKSDEMEDVQNELRRKYEIVFKPAVLWPNINFSLRTFTAYYSSSSLV